MPIYEYSCSSCNHQFDVIQKINDDPVKDCPACAKPTVIRLVSAPGFQLKGTGWYATDFKNKGKPAEKKSETSSGEGNNKESAETKTTVATSESSSATQTKGEVD